MCKILTLTNMTKIKNTNKLINTIAASMAKREGDGFGYALQGNSGVYGEKTTTPDNFRTDFVSEILNLPFVVQTYDRFGKKDKAVGAGIFHGRTSTNNVSLVNTHPLVKHDWTLIHNGVVTNHGPKYNMISTNDTEHLVELLGTQGIDAIEKHITGYYAISAFSPDNRLHIIKDNIASLHVAFCKSIDSYIFGTTEDLIQEVCKAMSWKTSKISPVADNQHLVFVGNKIDHIADIKPRGRDSYSSGLASKSLGHELSNYYQEDYTYGKQWDTSLVSAKTDKELFLEEVNYYADSSYTFLDFRQNPMTINEFLALEDDTKCYCTVIRSDGTVVCPENYHTERLYTGNVRSRF